MSTATPFTFAQDFSVSPAKAAAEALRRQTEELDAARASAQAQGFEAGYAQAQSQIEAATQTAVDTLCQAVPHAMEQVEALRATITAEAAALAADIARRLAGRAIEAWPTVELDRLADQIINEQMSQPRLVVRVADPLLDAVKTRLETRAAALGFAGRLIFLGEPLMAPGDASLEWADGGTALSFADRCAAIDAKVADFVTNMTQI
jgi:flagellar assembly protein FliH